MPELEPHTRPRDDAGGEPPDPLASLHKMSTTAGVGSQDYVAVNTLAVTTAVLGLATAFAFFAGIFLVVAAAAVVCGVIAIRQINDSNGTQGGKWLAILGIVAALGIAAIVASGALAEVRKRQAIAREVNAVVEQFGQHLLAGRYDEAYAITDPLFREVVTAEQFAQAWKLQQSPEFNGKLTSVRGNNIVSPMEQDGRTYAYTQVLFHFANRPDESRATLIFVRDDAGQWRLNRIVEMFQSLFKARGKAAQGNSPLK